MSNTGKINPQAFVFDMPKGMAAVRDNQTFMAENAHLALQFPIPELRWYFHPSYPGKQTTIQAQSHHGKTNFIDYWAHQAAQELAESGRKGIIIKINTEDSVEMQISAELAKGGAGTVDDLQTGIIRNPEQYIKVETAVGSLPIVFIGESMGMDDGNAAELYMSNIARLIDFSRKEYFAEEMPIAGIFLDYIHAMPYDPEIKARTNIEATRRTQIMEDENRIRRAAKYFSCPVIVNAQSKQDEALSTNGQMMKIPGFWDIQETSYISQHTDFLYSLWFPKMHYPVGSTQSHRDLPWSLKVKDNQMWVKVVKHKGYKNVGQSFPILLDEYGNMQLDKDTYNYIASTTTGGPK
jgi:hypothetical protein